MRETQQRLVTMANQIARNFALRGDVEAAKATADHVMTFWDPRMKQDAFGLLGQSEAEFSPIARSALEALSAGFEPEAQTDATRFNKVGEEGHSDAG